MKEQLKDLLRPLYHRVKYLPNRLKPIEKQSRNLHLGCGPIHVAGWCNVDLLDLPSVDIIDNISTLERFPANFADRIYACHVLEHLSHAEVVTTLKRWFEVLRPGGEVRISVPDLERIMRIYMKHPEHFATKGNSPWIGLIYGGQINRYDFHKTGFNFVWMAKLLEDAGFQDVAEYPHAPHFIPGVEDGSLGNVPFGEYFSLNVRAVKPQI